MANTMLVQQLRDPLKAEQNDPQPIGSQPIGSSGWSIDLSRAEQNDSQPIIPTLQNNDSLTGAGLEWLTSAGMKIDPAQNQGRVPDTTTSITTENTLLLKLGEIKDKNVYVLAEKVEILYRNSEETHEGTSASGDVVNVVTTVTNLVTALVGLLAALLSYKNTQKSKSKKSSDLFAEEGNELPLVQIIINNHGISIANFEAPDTLASSIFRQLGIQTQ